MKFWYWMIKLSFRRAMGRWYIWRDVPDDVVLAAAALRGRALDDDQESFLAGAVDELRLRMRSPRK